MRTITAFLLLYLALGGTVEAMDPPEILWARTIFPDQGGYFYDVHETPDGNFVLAGILPVDSSCAMLVDGDGDFIWAGGGPWFSQVSEWVEPLPDGSYIVTGRCKVLSSSSWGLMLTHLDADGSFLWGKVYDFPGTTEEGYSLLILPEGGFIITGRVNGSGLYIGQAWTLRVDEEGDTIWTDIWGAYTMNYASRAVMVSDSCEVLAFGRIHPDSSKGTHLLAYDLDGTLRRELRIADMGNDAGVDMCYDPIDNCFNIITGYQPYIAHVSNQGDVLWTGYIPGYGFPYGTSVSGTMDGGTVIGGYNVPNPDYPWEEYTGMVGRFDSEGNSEWGYYVSEEECHEIYCVRQLSQGGYIAAGATAGNQGLLIRYAPETGIEEGTSPSRSMHLDAPMPNPSSGSVSLSFDVPTSTYVDLAVYDLSGRCVAELVSETMSEGSHQTVWDAGDAPSGCYLVVLRTEDETLTRTCVRIL